MFLTSNQVVLIIFKELGGHFSIIKHIQTGFGQRMISETLLAISLYLYSKLLAAGCQQVTVL